MKILLYISSFLISSAHCYALDSKYIDRKVNETLLPPNSRKSDITWINDQNRQMVYDSLIQKMNLPEYRSQSYVQEALVRVGHPETIKHLISIATSDRNNYALFNAATMDAIPYLMEAINDKSIETISPPLTGDVGYSSTRDLFAITVCRAILKEPTIDPVTHAWADRMESEIGGPPQAEQRMNLLKQWWVKNQQAIIEKRYADATWLPMYKGKPSVLDWTEQEERRAERNQSKSFRKSELADVSDKVTEKSLSNTWEVVASFAALLFLILAFFRWKSSPKQSV
jgi:hypothetical protein